MKMKTPVIVINFKCYTEVNGEKGIQLAQICEDISKEHNVNIAISPQLVDLAIYCKKYTIPIFSQHVDAVEPGAYTGHITCESLKSIGAKGTLINHSEKRLKIADIEQIVCKCKGLELISLVCTNNLPVSNACALINPDFIAIEPPELIGGDISVTTAKPEVVLNTVNSIKEMNPKVKVLCGAGVKTGKDVAKAIELGTEGVLLASGVTKSKNPNQTLLDLISCM